VCELVWLEPKRNEPNRPEPNLKEMSAEKSWADLKPKSVGNEDALSDDQNKLVWEKLYKMVGAASAEEDTKKSIRLAVYAYCCVNGTSRDGQYEVPFKTSTGLEIDSAVIPQAASRMQIRKFLRSNMIESYEALKSSGVIEENARYVMKVSALGVSPACAFATADWLTDCPLFTPAENRAHEASFTASVERAKRSRGGHSLENVEKARVDAGLAAQGPAEASGPVTF